ncbi:MAG TPA: nuclear transport factor 2 family protein [Mycobacterium sp.]|nr:nuclear transport factor 2 family protein [Mycobacterium sp.]
MTLSVADRLDLSDLVHRYAAFVDARQFDDVAELFTTTAQLTVPKPPETLSPSVRHDGQAGVRAAMASLGGVIRTQHAIVGEVYTEATSDARARGFIVGVAHHWTEHDGRITDVVWYLRYADEYQRTDAGWRIALRALSIDAIETRPAGQVRH